MDIKEFAKSLDGREYGWPQFTKEEIATAKENGFVIVYGIGDYLVEFRGAVMDEVYCFDDSVNIPMEDKSRITALWCDKESLDENGNLITWAYKTDIPHETFMIYDDGEPYCRGIVFKIEDLEG